MAFLYTTTNDFRLAGYSDNEWERSVNNRNIMSRYVFHLVQEPFHGPPRKIR